MNISILKNLFMFVVLIHFGLNSVMAKSSSTNEQKRELRKKVYKTELFLKDVIRKDLDQQLSQSKPIIKVKLDINSKKIFNEVGGLDNKWDKIKTMQLPGLFIDQSAQADLKEVKKISVENVLSHITQMNVELILSDKDIDIQSLKSTVTQIVKSNYNRFDKIKLNIETKFDEKLLKVKVDDKKSALKIPEIKTTTKNNDLPSSLIYLAIGISAIFLLVVAYFVRDLSGNVKNVRDTIESKDMASTLSLDALPEMKNPEQKPEAPQVQNAVQGKTTSAYDETISKMQYMLSDYSDVFSEMISFNMQTENFVDLVILMEVVPKETRASVYNQLASEKVEKFRKFLVNHGEGLYQTGEELRLHAEKMISLLKLSAIDSEQFYSYYFKSIISRLDTEDFKKIINHSSINELMYLAEYAQTNKVAYAMMTTDFDKMKLTCDYAPLTQPEIKTYLEKISEICFVDNLPYYNDVREKLLPYLNNELEKVVVNKLKLNVTQTFSTLVENNFDFVCNFIQSLVYVDKKEILAVFDENLKSQILATLPEIVTERLSKESLEVTESSLYLKSVLYNDLVSSTSAEFIEYVVQEKHAA